MDIVYADDDRLSLEIVLKALQSRGHHVTTVDTSKLNDMLVQFQGLINQGPVPQVIILDGHNVATDQAGRPLVDVQSDQILSWLQQQGLPSETRCILYSSDDQMVAQAQQNRNLGFSAAVPKAGLQGGLKALLREIELN